LIENNKIENSEISTNFPNPFIDQTTISFNLEQSSFVNLRIYDLSGKVVQTLINKQMTDGQHSVIWNGKVFPEKNFLQDFIFMKLILIWADSERRLRRFSII